MAQENFICTNHKHTQARPQHEHAETPHLALGRRTRSGEEQGGPPKDTAGLGGHMPRQQQQAQPEGPRARPPPRQHLQRKPGSQKHPGDPRTTDWPLPGSPPSPSAPTRTARGPRTPDPRVDSHAYRAAATSLRGPTTVRAAGDAWGRDLHRRSRGLPRPKASLLGHREPDRPWPSAGEDRPAAGRLTKMTESPQGRIRPLLRSLPCRSAGRGALPPAL